MASEGLVCLLTFFSHFSIEFLFFLIDFSSLYILEVNTFEILFNVNIFSKFVP